MFFPLITGEEFTWSVQISGYTAQSVTVNAQSPILPFVEPLHDCLMTSSQSSQKLGIMGYMNPNPFDIFIPIGELNMFRPGAKDRAQPAQFFSGLNKGVFTVPYEPDLQWLLPGKKADVSLSTTKCDCPVTDNVQIKKEVIELSRDFLAVGYQSADTLQNESRTGLHKVNKEQRARLRELMGRSKERSVNAFAQIQHILTSSIQDSSINCPIVPNGCSTVDDGPLLDSIRARYFIALNSIRRISARASFLGSGQTKKHRKLVKRGTALSSQALQALNKVQRFRTVCSSAKVAPTPTRSPSIIDEKPGPGN